MNRILYQKTNRGLNRLGDIPNCYLDKLSSFTYSTLIKAPDIRIPKIVKVRDSINIEIPANRFVSAVDTRYLFYKINRGNIKQLEIPREIFNNNGVFKFSITVPPCHSTMTIFYRTQDWIENLSPVKFVQSIVEEQRKS